MDETRGEGTPTINKGRGGLNRRVRRRRPSRRMPCLAARRWAPSAQRPSPTGRVPRGSADKSRRVLDCTANRQGVSLRGGWPRGSSLARPDPVEPYGIHRQGGLLTFPEPVSPATPSLSCKTTLLTTPVVNREPGLRTSPPRLHLVKQITSLRRGAQHLSPHAAQLARQRSQRGTRLTATHTLGQKQRQLAAPRIVKAGGLQLGADRIQQGTPSRERFGPPRPRGDRGRCLVVTHPAVIAAKPGCSALGAVFDPTKVAVPRHWQTSTST